MQIKLLQLNMWAGTHLSKIKDFIASNDFDILCFQEVSGIGAVQGNIMSTREGYLQDSFLELQKTLKEYTGELAIAQYMESNPKKAYFGIAIFYKKGFVLTGKNIITLFKRTTPFPSNATSFEDVGRNALHVLLKKDGKTVNVITGHLAWAQTKFEEPHQRKQNLKLIQYMEKIKTPWILTGDFNINPEEQSILDLEKLGRNLGKEYGIENTIDPMHRAWEKIKPGFVIDYIFVSPDVKVDDFQVLNNVHMSDHLGLTATLEV